MKYLFILLSLLPVSVKAQSISIVSSDTTICGGTSAHFMAVASGMPHPHYRWLINGIHYGVDDTSFSTTLLHNGDTVSCRLTNLSGDSVFATSGNVVMIVQTMPYAGTLLGPDTISICESATLTLAASITGGIWTMSNGHASDSAGVLKGLKNKDYGCGYPSLDTVYYIVSNLCGSDTARKLVVVTPLPNAYFELGIAAGSINLCLNGWINIVNAPDMNFCTGNFTSQNGLISISGPFVTPVKAGTDSIICITTNQCGTSRYGMSVIIVDTPKRAQIVYSVSELCVGSIDSVSFASNGNSEPTYSSLGHLDISSNGLSAMVSALSAGEDSIIVVWTGMCGHIYQFIPVKIDPLPARFTGPDSVCKDYSVSLYDSAAGGVWSTDNSGIASVNQATGEVAGISEGTTLIKYTLPTGCYDSAGITVTNCKSEFDIYPNPSANEITIHLYVNLFDRYMLYNILGQVIATGELQVVNTNLDLTYVATGLYFLKLEGPHAYRVKKIIRD